MDKEKNYLFICLAGRQRSPSAVNVAYKLASKNNKKIKADSCALISLVYLPIDSLNNALNLYDHLFVMEDYMKDSLINKIRFDESKITCLEIKDIYEKDSPELTSILEEKLQGLI